MHTHAYTPQCGLPNKVTDMPSWWSPEHDAQLVAGVLAHGFGEWDTVLQDSACSFLSCQEAYVLRVRVCCCEDA